jgi:hypothetical protein
VSPWNAYLDRVLSCDLNASEHQLVLVLMRLILGYQKSEQHLGRELIRERARMDGRTLERARAGLVAKGLLEYESGGRGQGRRSRYRLLLGDATPLEENVVASRPKRKTPAAAETKTLSADVIDAYLAAGGSLELAKWRDALIGQAHLLTRKGYGDAEILDAARQLAREGRFPGFLQEAATTLRETGGFCSWQGYAKDRLTPEQLAECGCRNCAEWAAALTRTAGGAA